MCAIPGYHQETDLLVATVAEDPAPGLETSILRLERLVLNVLHLGWRFQTPLESMAMDAAENGVPALGTPFTVVDPTPLETA